MPGIEKCHTPPGITDNPLPPYILFGTQTLINPKPILGGATRMQAIPTSPTIRRRRRRKRTIKPFESNPKAVRVFDRDEWPRLAYYLDQITADMDWYTFRKASWYYDDDAYGIGDSIGDKAYLYCHKEAKEYPKKISIGPSSYVFCLPCWKEFYENSDYLLNDLQSYAKRKDDERKQKKVSQLALPKPPQGTTTTQEASQAKAEYGPFLNVEKTTRLLGDDGSVICKIADRPPNRKAKAEGVNGPAEGRFGIDIPLDTPEGKAVFSVRTNTQNYSDLFDAFGPDEADWVGQSVRLSVQESVWSGRDFVKTEPIPTEPGQ